jgi:hypothetical protein
MMRPNQPAAVITQPRIPKCPQLAFSNATDSNQLQQHLTAYMQWFNNPGISPSKKLILGNIISYLSDINKSRTKRLLTNESRYIACSNILALGDFPDILLTQYIIKQLSSINDVSSKLRDNNLFLAKQQMDILIRPHIRQSQQIGFGLMALALFCQLTGYAPTGASMLVGLVGLLLVAGGRYVTDIRIGNALDERIEALNARSLGLDPNAEPEALDDGLDPLFSSATEIVATGTRLLYGFFSQQLQRFHALEQRIEGHDQPRLNRN